MKKIFISMIIVWFSCCPVVLGEFENVNIHGFISQGYLRTTENDYFFSDTKDGTFQFNEIGLNFGKNLTDDLRLSIQFLAKDLGVLGNDEVTIDYAMGDYRFRNWLGIRVGKIKRPHGLYNQSRDVDAGRLNILLPQSLYHELYRDQLLSVKGAGFYGIFFDQLNYQVYYGTMDISLDSGLGYILRDQVPIPPIGFDVDPLLDVYFLWNTPLPGLNLAATYVKFKWDVNITDTMAVEFDGYQVVGSIEYTYGNFMLSAEYSRTPTDVLAPGMNAPYLQEGEAYYGSAAYQLTPWFQFGGGYCVWYTDIEIRDDDPENYLKDAFLSLRFDINDYWILKLEGHKMDTLASIENPDTAEKDWFMFAGKLTFSF